MNSEIQTNAEYEAKLARMEKLIDDYESNRPEIERLAAAIEQWEDTAEEFSAFNAAVAAATERDAKR